MTGGGKSKRKLLADGMLKEIGRMVDGLMDELLTREDAKDQHSARVAVTKDTEPDWTRKCKNCGESPILPITGLCGPCTFGEADTAGGNW